MQKKPVTPSQSEHPTVWQENIKKEERKNLLKKIGIWAAIVIACLAGLALLVKLAADSGPSAIPVVNNDLKQTTSNDIVTGNPNAKVTIITYSDFGCPACANYNSNLNQVLQEFEGKVNVVFRFFPLQSIHKNAVLSASAAYAAHKQGKFEEMKDMLFENQNDWENLNEKDAKITFLAYANKIGLDPVKFEADMNSKETRTIVIAGERDALGLGLNSTPTVFVNNKQIAPQGYESLKNRVEEELNIQTPLK